MLALATPPIDIYPAAWVGQALFAFSLFDEEEPHTRSGGALRGWLFGTSVNVLVLRFVPHTIARFTDLPRALALLALLLLAMFQGLRWLLAGWITQKLRQRRVPSFLAFAIAVWVSTFVPGVFGWTVAGGISKWTTLVQLADVVGERGVSALLALSSALLAVGVCVWLVGDKKRSASYAALSIAIPVAMITEGVLRIGSIEAERLKAPKARVALVQPSTEARTRWDPQAADSILRRLTMLTIAAEQRGTDLVVWPEAAYPYAMAATAKADLVGQWAVLQPGVRGPVLFGLLMQTTDGAYNSAALVHGSHIDAPYHKMHLLAFGEAVPLSGVFPALRHAFARGTGMVPGDHQVLLESGPMRATVLNCFEDTLPEAGLEAADVNPNLLVNLTNDAWFSGTEESELHLRIATMRAIELRRDFVRAVNLGPTTWVDATGKIRARYDLDIPGSLPTQPALLEMKTVFGRLGDLSGALLLALLSLATWLGMRTKRVTKRERRAALDDTPLRG
jgi:apolipoprotein N-acyltransferase